MNTSDFTKEGYFYTMGRAPVRVDIVIDPKGVSFEDCWARRSHSRIGEMTVPFISAEDLVVNKEAVGCHQDLADAEKVRIALARKSGDNELPRLPL